MGPVLAPPTQERSEERDQAHPVAATRDLRALASAVGNRQFARVARTAYWAEYDGNRESNRRSGSDVHQEVLTALGVRNKLFTEASVPGANKGGAAIGEDTRGYADLYKAKTTVGVTFTGHQQPEALPSHPKLRHQGDKYPHAKKAAPRVRERGFGTKAGDKPLIVDLDRAPQEIAIGDLKGGFESIEAAEAPEQLDSYLTGFRDAADQVNEYARDNHDLVEPRGAREWHPELRKLRKREVRIPDFYRPGKANAQPSARLVLVGTSGFADMKFSMRNRVLGKLYVFADPERDGVWAYVWAPDQEVPLDDLPDDVRELGTAVANQLRRPLLRPPLARRVRAGVARLRALVARQTPAQEKPAEDPLNYDQWVLDHKELSEKAATADSEPGWIDAEAAAKVDEANATARKFGLKAPKVSGEKLKGGQDVKQIKLWTGKTGSLLGTFRRLFGTAFTGIANVYGKIRTKVRELLSPARDKGKSFGGGFPGAALKAAYSVIKRVARYIVTKTAERLKTSLVEGTTAKLKELIGSERVEQVEEAFEDVVRIVTELKSGVVGKLEDMFNGVVETYSKIVGEIERVKKIVGEALDIVDKVKWGARVIACLSPPGLGCLWILAQSVLEKAAAKVVDTCWFKRKITPLITGLDFVKELPVRMAKAILDVVRPLLPEPLQDMFQKIDTDPLPVSENDIGCDTNDDPQTDALTIERRAWYDLIEAVGEERFDALVDALMAAGVRFDKRLTVSEIYEAKKIIVGSRVTTEQLRHYAKWYAPFADKRKFGPLGEFVNGLAKSDPQSVGPFAEEESGEGEGEGGATGTAIEATPTTAPRPSGPNKQYKLVRLGAFDLLAPKGTPVTMDITVEVDGQTVVLRKVALVVADREKLSGGDEKVKLVPVREMVFELDGGAAGSPKRTMTLSKTSTFTKMVIHKRAGAKQRTPAPEPALAPSGGA
jgi:hypothetical protein